MHFRVQSQAQVYINTYILDEGTPLFFHFC